jgi:hypothetical protein
VSATPNGASNSAGLPTAIPPERYRPQWFTISPSVAQIEPGREQVFRVTSTVPRGSAGEYFAYLLLTPSHAGSAGSALPPTGALLGVTAKGTAAQEAQLDDVAVRSAHGSTPTYSFKITNTGNVSSALTGVVAVLASDGKEIDRKPFTLPLLLLPSCSIAVKVDGERPLPPGNHKIRVTVNTEGGRPVSKETVVVVK